MSNHTANSGMDEAPLVFVVYVFWCFSASPFPSWQNNREKTDLFVAMSCNDLVNVLLQNNGGDRNVRDVQHVGMNL